MSPFRQLAHSRRQLGRRRAPVWAAVLGALSLFAAACSQGTSSGVDNPAVIPSLTVSFMTGGVAARVKVNPGR